MTIRSLEEAGLRESQVLVGGAPVTPPFTDSIGANGFAPDGATAGVKARELMTQAGRKPSLPMREAYRGRREGISSYDTRRANCVMG